MAGRGVATLLSPPSATPLPVSRRYQGAAGAEYFQAHFPTTQAYGRILQSQHFRPYCRDDLRLLDFGCGDGTILRALPAKLRIGIEVNPTCVAKILHDNETQQPPIDVRRDLADVADASIDVAISNHALEHTLHPTETLAQLRRVLVGGGRLVLVTPFDDWRSPGHRRWQPDDRNNHLFTWTPLNLGNLLTEAGFVVAETRLLSRAWSPRLFWIRRRLGTAAFDLACAALARLRHRREVFALARKP